MFGKNTNCTALIFRIHHFLPIIFMTFLVNIITIAADHNLFSWLQTNETNCCDITAWAKQEQTARQPSSHQLLALKGSEYTKEIKITSSPFAFPPLEQRGPLNRGHHSHRWIIKTTEQGCSYLKNRHGSRQPFPSFPSKIWRMDFVKQ